MVNAYVVEATLALQDGCDPAGVGAAVTVELCGHWEHDGACRWPHNNAIAPDEKLAQFRTVFIADHADAAEVRARIESVLWRGPEWRALSLAARPVAPEEQDLADRLLAAPRL